ncbi:MAG: VacJ family lipoprotein [Alphaproteobacteria bacterium]|jgi:phospholipid-binding lipoprotein MlaA|nr:VacJ family lipoprotein [Alphaproteobacteria bacterium]
MSTFSENLSRTARATIAGAGLMALLAAPAVADEEKISDPLEPINRVTSGFNDMLRTFVVDPLIGMYQGVTPKTVQDAVSNAASNLSEPVTAASSLLQGDMKNAGTATKRFLINSTVGLGGTQDKAKEMGLEQRREDLGQALGKHGFLPGPHIVLPLLGPSNLRDAAADIATGLASPIPLAGKAALGAVEYSDKKETARELREGAIDRYAAERSAYEQYRANQVRNNEVPATGFAEIPDYKEKEK